MCVHTDRPPPMAQMQNHPRWEVLMLQLALSLCHVVSGAPVVCYEPDRTALLGFKVRIAEDTTGALSSWRGRDCCDGSWEGVECNPATGRVVGVRLQRPGDRESGGKMYMKGALSPCLGALPLLEALVISGMKHLSGPIPYSFSNLTLLKQLVLEDNSLAGSLPLFWGPSLQVLSLSGNRFHGLIPPSLGSLPSLVQLNLGRNSLSGPIPPSFTHLRSLQSIDLSSNLLTGPLPNFFPHLPNLTFIDLSHNHFSGPIPTSICSLPALLDLSLSHNQLTGPIPLQIGSLQSLTTLSLAHNLLTGPLPPSILRLRNLWQLNLSTNGLSDPLPPVLARDLPSLLSIDLSFNNFSLGTLPQWIRDRVLADVHLAGCRLRGTLPIFSRPDSLTSIDLSHNSFTDGISNFFINMSSLQKANLSHNQLHSDISKLTLPQGLSSLDLHSNHLSGSLYALLNNIGSFLEIIDVSSNQISGGIPEFIEGLSLKSLNIAANQITGHIPNSITHLIEIQKLDISRNRITGTIPTGLGLLLKIQWLDVSINMLTGKIPETMLGIEGLRHANFRANRLCGEIPQGRPFNIFPPAAYAHNLCLCGKPMPPCRGRPR